MLRRLRRLRVSAIFYTVAGLCAILLLVNFNEDVKKLLVQSSPSSPGSQFFPRHTFPAASVKSYAPTDDIPSSVDEGVLSLNAKVRKRTPARKEGDLEPEPDPGSGEDKPWYMWGGSKYPALTSGLPSSAVDEARLWYEDNLNNDRILEQLNFWIDDPTNSPNSSVSWYPETGGTGTSDTPGSSPGSNDVKKTTVVEEDEDFLSSVALSTGSVALSPGSTPRLGMNDSASGRLFQGGSGRRGKLKTILLYYGLGMSWGSHITPGRSVFLSQKCPVNACRLSGNRAGLGKADLVLFKDVFMNPKVKRNPSQLWIMYMLECPLNTQNFVDKNVFNLTATYRHDSDIVTPYEKWVYYDDNAKTLEQGVNYAEGKTKKVAWFVSNCVAKNNRLDYARELSKYIDVDIYGACGTHSCSRANAKQCFELLAKNYKFYLAFENSNCRDYISEKFFVNGLGNNVLPIVMGAHPNDYKRVAPAKSYIHVDDFASPKELADYLYLLDKNNELYNEYFQWKGTGEFINTHFFCRLCAMAHYADKSERKPRHYKDFNRWWRGPNVCTRRSWRNQPDIFSPQHYERLTEDN